MDIKNQQQKEQQLLHSIIKKKKYNVKTKVKLYIIDQFKKNSVPRFIQPVNLYLYPPNLYLKDKNCQTSIYLDGIFTAVNHYLQIKSIDVFNDKLVLNMLSLENPQQFAQNFQLLTDRLLSLNDENAYKFYKSLEKFQTLVKQLSDLPQKIKQQLSQKKFQSLEDYNFQIEKLQNVYEKKYPYMCGKINVKDKSQKQQFKDKQFAYITINKLMAEMIFKNIENCRQFCIVHGVPGVFHGLSYFEFMTDFMNTRLNIINNPKQNCFSNKFLFLNQKTNQYENYIAKMKEHNYYSDLYCERFLICYFKKCNLQNDQQKQSVARNSFQQNLNPKKYDKQVDNFFQQFYGIQASEIGQKKKQTQAQYNFI